MGTNTVLGSSPVVSVSPVVLASSGREPVLQVRVSAPVGGRGLPVIVFSHGFGSSMDGYAPLVQYWAAHGFVVIQPTFLDSRTLIADPKAGHEEAIAAFLNDPRKHSIWRQRVADVKHVLDQLAFVEDAVPGLAGRVDHRLIAAAGHSFGAHTTGLLMGARVIGADGRLGDDFFDARIRAGVLLSAGGRGGADLSPFATEHFPYLNQDYTDMRTPSLVVAGDQDRSPLTLRGPDWFTDVYRLSPGARSLLTLFGGEHMLGGISGHLVRETTDEEPGRVAAVQRMSGAFLRSRLFPGDPVWEETCDEWLLTPEPIGRIDNKRE